MANSTRLNEEVGLARLSARSGTDGNEEVGQV